MNSRAAAPPRPAGSCRLCRVSCDRVVHPAGCVESGCPRLYSHRVGDRTLIGCLEGVYGVEIDLGRLLELEGTRAGFGGLRALREPLPCCRSEVERTFEHRGDGPCVNPDFLLSGGESVYSVTAAPAAGGAAS